MADQAATRAGTGAADGVRRGISRRITRDAVGARRTTARPIGRFAAGRATLSAWLRRPMTSLHLVLGVFGLLTMLGLVMVLSASSVESYAQVGSSYRVFSKQLMYCGLGLVLFWVGLLVPPRLLRSATPVLIGLSVLLLVGVLVPGVGARINGSRSWFLIAGVSFQPAEPAKVALALWGAHALVTRRKMLHRWRHVLVPVVPIGLVIFTLVVLQPDLGTTISLVIVLLALLFFAGAPLRLVGALTAGAVLGALALGLAANYRQSRISAFLHPDTADPLGPGYQARQALYSLADGGLWGAGLGQGRAKWSYLPNAHNDFIFAIIGEELGFIGAFAVLALFAAFAYTGLRIAGRNADPWIRVSAATLTVWLVAQAAINIGYVVGLLPVTGIPLPLVSSGGTSLVLTMFVFGLLANFARHEPEAVAALRSGAPGSSGPGGTGGGPGRLARLLRLPAPLPYRAPVSTPRPGLRRPPAARGPVRRPAPPRCGARR